MNKHEAGIKAIQGNKVECIDVQSDSDNNVTSLTLKLSNNQLVVITPISNMFGETSLIIEVEK